MTIPSALKKYKENMEALASDAYKDHQFKRQDERRWLIQRKTDTGWQGFHWTEIIMVTGGVLVHGDGDTCLFKHYYPPKGEDDPIGAARWMARAQDAYLREKANLGMDTSGIEGVNTTFDDEVAVWEMECRIDDRVHEVADEAGNIFDSIEVEKGELKVDEEYYTRDSEDFEDCDDLDPAKERENDVAEVRLTINEALKEDKELAAWKKAVKSLKNGWESWYFVQRELYEDLCDADVDAGELMEGIGIVPAPRLYYARAALRRFVELYDAEKAATNDAA